MENNDIEWLVNVEDGKYTIRFHKQGYLSFLRHGKSWEVANEEFKHVKMILCMAQELYEFKNKIKLHGSNIHYEGKSNTYDRFETKTIQDMGLCGFIYGIKPSESACLLEIGHDGKCGPQITPLLPRHSEIKKSPGHSDIIPGKI